jgi:hypothetical protein
MASPSVALKSASLPNTCQLQVRVFDGTRNLLPSATDILYRIIDANQKQVFVGEKNTPLVSFDLPPHDNFLDTYTVIVFADGYKQAGFTPVKLSRSTPTTLDLMLLPKDASYNFADASWDAMKSKLPFLAKGADDATGKQRYEDLMEQKPNSLASLLNLTTAMAQIQLPQGTPLQYLKQIKWDASLAQDRFFAYCDPELLNQVRTAAAQGEFAPEINPGFFHPDATASWKQIQFGEANVQLTFHEGDTLVIDGQTCIVVEPNIDYYRDLAAHALLEVIPNAITRTLTNPHEVYVLRWIAGRHAGVAEFNPPYTIVG